MALNTNQIIGLVVVIIVVAAGAIALLNMPGGTDSDDKITYIGNGGHTDHGEDKITFSSSEVSENMFYSDTNRAFKEWNTKADGTGTSYKGGDKLKGGATLYAIWYPHLVGMVSYSGSGAFTVSPSVAVNNKIVMSGSGFDDIAESFAGLYSSKIVAWGGVNLIDQNTILQVNGTTNDDKDVVIELKLKDKATGNPVVMTDCRIITIEGIYYLPIAYVDMTGITDIDISVNVKAV